MTKDQKLKIIEYYLRSADGISVLEDSEEMSGVGPDEVRDYLDHLKSRVL